MVKLKVSWEESERLLNTIDDATFQDARRNYWIVSHNGYIRAQASVWFFCWAKTGHEG